MNSETYEQARQLDKIIKEISTDIDLIDSTLSKINKIQDYINTLASIEIYIGENETFVIRIRDTIELEAILNILKSTRAGELLDLRNQFEKL